MRVSIVTLAAAAYTGLASACVQQPVGSNPSGNPISAPVLQVVPAGKPFDITWEPTTPGTVSIVLLRGPAINVIPIDCLGDNIPNTGKFSWTPATTLEPDVTGYGLQIIVTGTGQFQYSTQFGISNSNPPVSKSSSTAGSAGASSGKPTAQPATSAPTSPKPITQITDGQMQVPTSAPVSSYTPIITLKNNSTTSVPGSVRSTSSKATLVHSSTSTSASIKVSTRANSTVVLPTKTPSKPVTLKTYTSVKLLPSPSSAATATGGNSSSSDQTPTASSTLAVSTGAAGRLVAQGGVVGLVGIFMAALL